MLSGFFSLARCVLEDEFVAFAKVVSMLNKDDTSFWLIDGGGTKKFCHKLSSPYFLIQRIVQQS